MPSSDDLLALLGTQTVIPVLVVADASLMVPLARALARGGLPVIEITLRTPDALEAIRRAAAEVPEAVVGAGTILSPPQYRQAVEAGARFVVSPGVTPTLLDAARDHGVPFLPGVSTVGEAMAAAEAGLSFLKFFPAQAAGGAPFLRSLASPLPEIRFCPTGGVSLANAEDYLTLPNVACVGGSWVAPERMVAEGAWDRVEDLAREAARLSREAARAPAHKPRLEGNR